MSTDVNGKKCGACGAYLFDEDDVVFCPVCGAPHHRECYNSLGRCAYESFHGTDRQYDKVKEEPEQKNTNPYKPPSEEKSEETNPLNFIQFDTLGGVPEDFDLGDGVTAAEARTFVFSNSHRYIPKFAAAKYGKKASFNWLAFLLPPAWFLSRKMYKLGVFLLVISVSFTLLTFPFMLEFQNYISGDELYNYSDMMQIFAENIKNFEITGMITCFLASVGNILMSVFCGIFGDYFYRNHTIGTIKDIKEEGLDISENMRKKGGVSFFAAIIGFFVVRYLPTIIYGFII